MSATSSRCGAVVSQSEKARNANSFFERLSALLDDECVATTNRDDMELALRGQMCRATDYLQRLMRLALQFHQFRFSDNPYRLVMAAEVAQKFVYFHKKFHQSDAGTQFLQTVDTIDRLAKYTPQPDFLGFQHKSWARVVNKIMWTHYCLFDDAFEAAALAEDNATDEPGIEESESSPWTPEAFAELCQHVDEHPLKILSFNASSWPVEQESDKQSPVGPPPDPMAGGGRDEADGQIPQDDLWITGGEAERQTLANRGTIKRAADDGKILTNGKSGRDKRFHVASVHAWNKTRVPMAE